MIIFDEYIKRPFKDKNERMIVIGGRCSGKQEAYKRYLEDIYAKKKKNQAAINRR